MSEMSFNPMRFIADNAGLNIFEAIDKAYWQGRADEKRENEQDAYHRGYIDGQAKCSFDNEMKIRADERERIMSIVTRCIAHNVYNVIEGKNLLDEIKEEIVRGGENE